MCRTYYFGKQCPQRSALCYIGAPKTLSSALRLRGGVVETFEFWGIQVKIKTVEKLHIPALKAPRSFEYAKTVESKEAAK